MSKPSQCIFVWKISSSHIGWGTVFFSVVNIGNKFLLNKNLKCFDLHCGNAQVFADNHRKETPLILEELEKKRRKVSVHLTRKDMALPTMPIGIRNGKNPRLMPSAVRGREQDTHTRKLSQELRDPDVLSPMSITKCFMQIIQPVGLEF